MVKDLVVQPPGVGWVCARALAAANARRKTDASMTMVMYYCLETPQSDKLTGRGDRGLLDEKEKQSRRYHAGVHLQMPLFM